MLSGQPGAQPALQPAATDPNAAGDVLRPAASGTSRASRRAARVEFSPSTPGMERAGEVRGTALRWLPTQQPVPS